MEAPDYTDLCEKVTDEVHTLIRLKNAVNIECPFYGDWIMTYKNGGRGEWCKSYPPSYVDECLSNDQVSFSFQCDNSQDTKGKKLMAWDVAGTLDNSLKIGRLMIRPILFPS